MQAGGPASTFAQCSKILAMEREVRYCTTEDGVNSAYCVEGEGPALLIIPLFVES